MVSQFGMWWMMVLPFALLAGIVTPCLWLIARTVTRPRRGVREPSCEKCRYPVSGLTALACPECGRDLRLGGIITPAMEMRRRGSVLGAILAFSLLMVMVLYIGLALVSWGAISTAAGASKSVTTLTPASKAYRSIDVEHDYATGMGKVTAVLLRNDGTRRCLELDTSARAFVSKDDAGVELSNGTLDEKTIAQWFLDCGLPPDDPIVRDEATDLDKAVDLIVGGSYALSSARFKRLTAGAPTFGATAAQTQTWSASANLAVPLAAFGLWFLGIVLIIWRRRRLLREADGMDAATIPPPAVAPAATVP